MEEYINNMLERLHAAMDRGDEKQKAAIEKDMAARLNRPSGDACFGASDARPRA